MKHPLACILAITTIVVFLGTDCAFGQYSIAVISNYRLKIVGCYKENAGNRNIPDRLFDDKVGFNSNVKVNWNNFASYLVGSIARCASQTRARGFSFFGFPSPGACYSGKSVSATYARLGTSTSCKNGTLQQCQANQDCVGNADAANYVYKLEAIPTTKPPPTTKPAPTTKPTGSGAQLSALSCQSYLVAIKASALSSGNPGVPTPGKVTTKPTVPGKATQPTAGTPATPAPTLSPQAALEAKIKGIYKGYSCMTCLKTVNASSSTVFMMLQFTCQGLHLKKLVDGLGVSNIIKAECYPPACSSAMYPCTSPCGMATCAMIPSTSYPTVCPAPAPVPPLPPPPAPLPPPQCPMSCPPQCAPACNTFCCRSLIGNKIKTGPSFKKSATSTLDDEDDDLDDDVNEEDEDENDDTDIDEAF